MSSLFVSRLYLIMILSILGGCATHVSQLPKDMNPQPDPHQVHLPDGAIISIQFPLSFTETALEQFSNEFVCGHNDLIGHPFSSCGQASFTNRYAPLLTEHSSYYAAELKTILGRYIDDHYVRLEPFVLDYQQGLFINQPLLDAPGVSTLVIEFYQFPEALNETAGSGYAPTFNIRTAPSQSPETCGNLVAVAGHHQFHKPTGTDCRNLAIRHALGFAPMHYFSGLKPELADYPKHKKGLQPGFVTISNSVWEKNQKDYLTRAIEDDFVVTAETVQNDTSDWIARLAVQALSLINIDAVFQQSFANYVERFDPALATRLHNQALQGSDQRNLSIIQGLLVAENDWMTLQDEILHETLVNGPYGKSFRQSRLLLADSYDKAQGLGWMQVGAVLLGGFSSGLFGGAHAYNPAALTSHVLATEQYFDQKQEALGQKLLESLAPGTVMRAKAIDISIGGMTTTISGASQSDIHDQLQALYRKLRT